MRNHKKFLSVILSVIMIISMFAGLNITSFAKLNVYYEIIDGEVTITDSDTYVSGHVEIPDTIDGYPVTVIGLNAFTYCDLITSVTVPDSVKTIELGAFSLMNRMAEITIGSGVTSIGANAFEYCMGLESFSVSEDNEYFSSDANGVLFDKNKTELIKYPARNKAVSYEVPYGVEKIDTMAFYQSVFLENITLPDTLAEIGSKVFAECDNLRNISIPGSLKEVGDKAFQYCDVLETVTFGEGVEYIGSWAFHDCTALSVCELPSTLIEIYNGAFAGCENLTEINLSENTKKLYDQVFYLCPNLRKISLPNTLEEIGDSCFAGCESLEDIAIPTALTYIGFSAFSGCNSLKSLTIPGNVENIDNVAFQGCDNLQRVVISEGVKDIGRSAFKNCSKLDTIVIPESVTYIGDSAIGSFEFSGPPDYTDILINGDEITIYGVPGSYAQQYAEETGINFDDVKNLPEEPETSETPDEPETPEEPEVPEEPDVPEDPETPDEPQPSEILSWDKDLYYKESDATAVLTVNHPAGAKIVALTVSNCFKYEQSGNSFIFDLSVYENPNHIVAYFSDGSTAETELFVIKDKTPVDVDIIWQGYEPDNSCAYLYLDMPWSVSIYSVECDNPDITFTAIDRNASFFFNGVTTDCEVTIMLTNGQILKTTLVPPEYKEPVIPDEPETQEIITYTWDKDYYTTDDKSAIITFNDIPAGAYIDDISFSDYIFLNFSWWGNSFEFELTGYPIKTDINFYFSTGQVVSANLRVHGSTIKEPVTDEPITDEPSTQPPYEQKTSKGDIDGNGKITAADARKILRMSAKLDAVNSTMKDIADYNSDGKLTASDARSVLRVSAKLEEWIKNNIYFA